METKLHLNPIDFEQFSFPETITVIDTKEQRVTRNVVWDDGYDANKVKNIDGNSLIYEFNGKAGNIDIKCIFENNSNQEVVKRKFVCSYYIDSKFLSPRRLQRMVGIRDL